MSAVGNSLLCLGDALVDLICERQVSDVAEADRFVPHFGGTVANVALLAARAGVGVSLAGGAGDDHWGRWLRDQLAGEGVDLRRFVLAAERQTPLAMTTVDSWGEASYVLYGEPGGLLASALAGDGPVESAVAEADALFISSNTLVGADEREVTMRVRELALERELPVVIDPNLRLHRWRSRTDAAASVNACVPGSLLLRASAEEAQQLTGEEDPERAAAALVKAGARNVVITLGADGAILRGRFRVDVPGISVAAISTIGAGDAVTASLLAQLASTGWYEPAIAAGLRDAVRAGADACERWGAVD